jgi:hypothetical protein
LKPQISFTVQRGKCLFGQHLGLLFCVLIYSWF